MLFNLRDESKFSTELELIEKECKESAFILSGNAMTFSLNLTIISPGAYSAFAKEAIEKIKKKNKRLIDNLIFLLFIVLQ
ncbi:hypothetical protein A2246_01320 [candidate division WOR-1 bacterium RIFOXYA2_FULL_37_7]|uniref:Uncharacterized protein n=1 Tax=candidate division WOR-1 bacterium RIFOXYB2_FULL_37_13 TaxID=1802579 RepID=A0A1F4SHP0_UNCSA|nr:MAG: hypothetical protein A2246_01320 [candidate division WOR-1 bacterium RIFOXYA2_FULL_37_7]OGC19909.1 MAG: hypothetical protein A2310_08755 [candidate division WOR-1 bacterium RIFOXYB2_FULL_37_13]